MRTRAAGRLHELLAAYLSELRAGRYSAALITNASRVLPRFFFFLSCRRIRDVRRVREEHLVTFARTLKETPSARQAPLSLASQASYLGVVKGFFGFIERRGLTLRNPAAELSLPAVHRLPRAVLSESQARRLLSSVVPASARERRDRAVLELLYGAGIRVGECERLNVSDLALAERVLMIRDGKGKKDRLVPVHERAANALDDYLQLGRNWFLRAHSDEALFLARGGQRLSRQSIEKLVRVRAAAAGIVRRVTPHMLRHACATHLLRGGASVRHAQALLGHKSLETTALYTRVTIRDLHDVIRRSHPREKHACRSDNR